MCVCDETARMLKNGKKGSNDGDGGDEESEKSGWCDAARSQKRGVTDR